jgi:nucleotide-binding universal stress UspA family protein
MRVVAVPEGFRIEDRLHQGRMSMVWRATHAGVPGTLALKVPLVGNSDDPAAIVAFETERAILPRLAGPHVPRVLGSGGFEEKPYLALELIPGGTLEERRAAAPLAAAEVADIGARVADALHAVHLQGVAHLDLSPDNVMFRPGGEAVLLDFGLARHERLPDLVAEEFQRPLGTAGWISPEQVLGVRDDPRSDLFALGAILYALTTGRTPFGEPEGARGLRQRLTSEPVPPRALAKDCPEWLQEIILRLLEVDPARRHESAEEAAFELRHPAQVALTQRAARHGRLRFIVQVRGRVPGFAVAQVSAAAAARAAERRRQAPVVMAAVDVVQGSEALAAALRRAVDLACAADPASRLTCVTVHRVAPGRGLNLAEGGRAVHVQRLLDLKRWAGALGVPAERVTFHVLVAPEPATALIEYARANLVDQVVIGARGSSALRRHLGSVSARVAAEAPCTVTVVRAPPEPGR